MDLNVLNSPVAQCVLALTVYFRDVNAKAELYCCVLPQIIFPILSVDDKRYCRYSGDSSKRLKTVGIYSHVHETRKGSRDMQVDEWRQLGYETECLNGGNWEFSVWK